MSLSRLGPIVSTRPSSKFSSLPDFFDGGRIDLKKWMACSSLLAAVLIAGVSVAQATNEFDQASPTFDQVQARANTLMTEAEIQKAVLENMQRQCDAQGRCWLMGTDSSGSNWTLSFNAGVGSQTLSSGSTIINLGDDANRNSSNPYYGFTVTYRRYNCETNLRIDPSMKRLLMTYQYSGINADGSTKRNFSPAELSLLSLYATLNAKLETCRPTGN